MLKRTFDIILALMVLVLLSPLFATLCVLVRLNLGAPIFFRQERPGLNAKLFTIYKLRTMKNSIDSDGQLLSDELRMTKFGSFLRSTSLDELPSLVNVLKGELSFVGPRPLLKEYLPLYNSFQMARHDVLPGITGWAQINGRNNLTWEKKFELDIWYVNNKSFFLDIKILFKTLLKVLKRENINQSGNVTAEGFKGNK